MKPKYRYRVDIVERERGRFPEILDVKFFDDEDEAKQFALKENSKNKPGPAPDFYIVAEGPKKVMVDA